MVQKTAPATFLPGSHMNFFWLFCLSSYPFFSSIIRKYALEWRKNPFVLETFVQRWQDRFRANFRTKRNKITEVVSPYFFIHEKKGIPGERKPCHFCLYGKKKNCKSFFLFDKLSVVRPPSECCYRGVSV